MDTNNFPIPFFEAGKKEMKIVNIAFWGIILSGHPAILERPRRERPCHAVCTCNEEPCFHRTDVYRLSGTDCRAL